MQSARRKDDKLVTTDFCSFANLFCQGAYGLQSELTESR